MLCARISHVKKAAHFIIDSLSGNRKKISSRRKYYIVFVTSVFLLMLQFWLPTPSPSFPFFPSEVAFRCFSQVTEKLLQLSKTELTDIKFRI